MSDQKLDKKVTIYDIADRAHTSPSTVGAVMNGSWRTRRISEKSANRIKSIADELGYAPNMQASALRRDRTHMIGMILPMYDNRYFGGIAEQFEREARDRGLMPITSCTRRDPKLELETVRQLLSYRVERVICTGATDPDGIAKLCARHNVPTINLDLPGTSAPSIISDNYLGAYKLTKALINLAEKRGKLRSKDVLFVGGRATDHNTSARIRAFSAALQEVGNEPIGAEILTCGYASNKSEAAFESHVTRTGILPDVLFVNSTISLEGVVRWISTHRRDALEDMIFGVYDWDPFGQFIAKDVLAVRQNVTAMVLAAFELIDTNRLGGSELIEIEPMIMFGGN